jgi:hypothetical protein
MAHLLAPERVRDAGLFHPGLVAVPHALRPKRHDWELAAPAPSSETRTPSRRHRRLRGPDDGVTWRKSLLQRAARAGAIVT